MFFNLVAAGAAPSCTGQATSYYRPQENSHTMPALARRGTDVSARCLRQAFFIISSCTRGIFCPQDGSISYISEARCLLRLNAAFKNKQGRKRGEMQLWKLTKQELGGKTDTAPPHVIKTAVLLGCCLRSFDFAVRAGSVFPGFR